MIEVKKLSKSFAAPVLQDISFVFEKGSMNYIIGKSGSGKSVLLKCMVGLYEPDAGAVLFDGDNFTTMPLRNRREVRKKIGMLFQSSALFDSLTVEENVMFPLRLFTRQSTSAMKDRARFCLQRVGIEGRNSHFPNQISGGMQKRVAIARAIAMNPQYLFCDEPNSGLDPQTSIRIDELIQSITDEFQSTTVVVSHDMNSVLETADKILFISEGKAAWKGDRESILDTDVPSVQDFVYASKFMQRIRHTMRAHRPQT